MAEPIRILRIIARLNVGGPAIHVSLATQGLATRGYQTRLLAGEVQPNEGDMEYFARERGIAVERVTGLGREIGGADVRAGMHLLRVMREWKPHVIHTHTAKAGALGRTAARLYMRTRKDGPVPAVVHTFHGHVLEGYFGRARSAFFRVVERRLAASTHRLVVPSTRIADDLIRMKIGKREQYRVVPLGFELDPFLVVPARDPAALHPLRSELGIPVDATVVAIVGRLTAIKNHEMFLQAASHLPRRTRTPIHFLIVGGGELRPKLEALVKEKGLAGLVHFAGWRRDLAALLREIDVLALTSINEGTPVSLIEAMAAGRVVVATAVGGIPDVIKDGETGLLVASGRDDLFAVAMGRLADDVDLRNRLAAAARADAEKRFRVSRLIDDLDALYKPLIS